jgi:chitin synthase
VVLITPVIMTIASHFEIAKIFDGYFNAKIENQQSFVYLLALSFFWFLSQTWITLHIWSPAEISNELVSDTKWYNSLLIDQSMSFSPTRHHDKVKESSSTSVFAVATMWRETSDEMLIILKSIFRMDKDQSRRRLARYCNNKVG